MNAVGNSLNEKFGEHAARHFSVFLRDAVDEIAEAEGEVSHVDGGALARSVVKIRKMRFGLQDALEKVGRGSVF